MTMHTPAKDRGATAKPNPTLYVEPAQQQTPETLAEPFASTGLAGEFVADLLSAMLTHERCGVHLYRACEGRTNNTVLRRKYQEFGEQTERHVEILERLIETAGGNPNYVSARARAVENMNSHVLASTFLLQDPVDPAATELAMLDAVFLAETIDHANWHALAQLTDAIHGDLHDPFAAAVGEVEDEEDEHLQWASDTRARLTLLQAKQDLPSQVGSAAENLIARVKSWFSE